MANGNGLTPAKTISICIAITIAVNSLALIFMQEYGKEISMLRADLVRRTDQRYRRTDAEKDIRENWRLINARFNNVNFRFSRNELQIQQCLEHIKKNP